MPKIVFDCNFVLFDETTSRAAPIQMGPYTDHLLDLLKEQISPEISLYGEKTEYYPSFIADYTLVLLQDLQEFAENYGSYDGWLISCKNDKDLDLYVDGIFIRLHLDDWVNVY